MASLSQTNLNIVCWVINGLAVGLSAARFYIRKYYIGRFYWDDAFHLLGLFFLTFHTALNTGSSTLVFQVSRYNSGLSKERPNLELYVKLSVASSMALWICLFAIKIAFLVFYRFLFNVSKRFMQAWWVVLAITIVSFWICVAGEIMYCGTGADLTDPNKCLSPGILSHQITVLEYSCALNVFSDLAIMILPLSMLKGLQMRTSIKYGLAAVFCCALLVVGFDLLRTVESAVGGGIKALNTLWTQLEMNVAVIVSCLPSCSAVINRKRPDKSGRATGNTYGRRLVQSEETTKNSLQSSESSRNLANSQDFDYKLDGHANRVAVQHIAMDNMGTSKGSRDRGKAFV